MTGRSLPFHSRPRKKREYPESRLQKAIVQHLLFSGAFFHSIPNQRQCSVQEHARLKAEGLRKGVADLLIVVDGKAHYMECKSEKGVLSDAQFEFCNDCAANGIPFASVQDIKTALEILSSWGAIKSARVAA